MSCHVASATRCPPRPWRAQKGTTSPLQLKNEQSLVIPQQSLSVGHRAAVTKWLQWSHPVSSAQLNSQLQGQLPGDEMACAKIVQPFETLWNYICLAPRAGGLELTTSAKSPAQCLIKVNPYITLLTHYGTCHLLLTREPKKASAQEGLPDAKLDKDQCPTVLRAKALPNQPNTKRRIQNFLKQF